MSKTVRELNLEKVDGETLFRCYKCEGCGGLIGKTPSRDLCNPGWYKCPACQGDCVLDWVANLMGGIPPRQEYGSSGTSASSGNFFKPIPTSKHESFFKRQEYYQRRKSIYKGGLNERRSKYV